MNDERLRELLKAHKGYAFEAGFDQESTDTLAALNELIASRERNEALYSEAEIRKAVRNRTGGETWVLEELREMRSNTAATKPGECCACHDRCIDCPLDKDAHRNRMADPGAPAPKPEISLDLGTKPAQTVRAVVDGDGNVLSHERLYSEEEVKEALGMWLMPAGVEEAMRRLRGEGGEPKSRAEAREERLQGLGYDAPKRDCELHDLGQPGLCTCRGVPL